jgi:uncharacterized protein YebE (UPF0316 family)
MENISNKILGFAGIGTIFIGIIYTYVGIITGILTTWGFTSLGLLLSFIDAVIFIVGFMLIFTSITNENHVVNLDENNEITGKLDTNDFKSLNK